MLNMRATASSGEGLNANVSGASFPALRKTLSGFRGYNGVPTVMVKTSDEGLPHLPADERQAACCSRW